MDGKLKSAMVRPLFVALTALACILTPVGSDALHAQAPPLVPAGRFYGTAAVNGFPAPTGATITAQSVSGAICGTGSVTNGAYLLDIQAYGDCGGPLAFYVNGQRSNQTAGLPSLLSGAALLNLSVSELPPPPPFNGALVYQTGWNLVAGPSGTVVNGAAGTLYTFQPGDSAYESLSPSSPLQAGAGYWARFDAPASQTLGYAGRTNIVRSIPSGQYALIGNPFGTPALVAGAGSVLTYDPARGYQQATVLQPGQGAWALSTGAPISIRPSLP